MANEVSTKVFGVFQRPLAAKGIAFDSIVEGTNITPERLRNKKERIDWPDFCTLLSNLRRHFTDDELVEVGRSYLRAPGLRFAFVIARLLLSPMDFYRWFSKPRQGVGNQMFTCIVPTHREPAKNEIELDLELPDGYDVCWEFFLISKGNVEELPRLLGLPRAKVTLTRIPRGGRYYIKVPQGTPLLTRVWRIFTWPFAARAAARELREAHEALQERYEELETARAKLDRLATRLRTAHTISDLVHHDLDLERTLKSIAQALVNEAQFEWSEIRTFEPEASAQFGTASDSVERFGRTLSASGRDIGKLVVVAKSSFDRTEREELLAFLEPTLAMALQNAIAYRELAEYKAGLERIVEQRTAELRQARDLLAGSVEQLRDAQEAREKFFANISHEIRTPLSLILLAAGDVERRAGHLLDERSKSGLVAVTDAARKLVRLVDELLLLAAGQADKFVLSREPTNLAALFVQLVAAWRPAAEAADLTFEARGPEKLFAYVDPVAIERLASNLLSNAVKYTPRGGRIDVELVATADGVRLSVFDTGPGIDPSLGSRLFGRFERAVGDDRRKAGTGIGLALVKQLVEAHEGTVSALPRPTGGTEFRVVLPASIVMDEGVPLPPTFLRTTHAPSAAPAIASGMVFTPTGLSNGTIVVAEDEPRLAQSVAQLLCDQYTVVVALDGNAALELVRQHQPQLLITDVDMPGLNGIEVARRFRDITGDRLAPIIMLSAVLDLRTRIAGLEAGAVDYIGKPFDPSELRARVQAQFRMRDLALRLHRAEQLSALGILTAGLAHELRNPANGIVNAIPPLMELLPAELIGPETGPGQLLEVMKGCADHIAFLTRQLLGFRNNTQLELRPASLSELVNRAVKLAKGALVGVDVRTDVEAVKSPVMCAPPLLVQVLTNLVENAGHAAGPGGWVEVVAHAAGGRVTVEVADSGPGVPVELRERVFEPFFTTKSPGLGTGLGLSLARNIVHRHGGVLEIRPRGEASVFVIELNAESNLAPSVNAV